MKSGPVCPARQIERGSMRPSRRKEAFHIQEEPLQQW
jgi:hypothetical protein